MDDDVSWNEPINNKFDYLPMNGELIDDLQAIIINKIVAIALQVITGRNMAGVDIKQQHLWGTYIYIY